MNLQESGEMYLETILVLSKRLPVVRSIDIAHELNYSKPSVSRAIGLLKKDEYIIVDSKGYIELTDKGLKVATTIYDRHDTLSSFFESIGVSHDTAVNDACRIEHVISDETIDYVGILAKLELSDEEKEKAKKDMEEMLDYIDKLNGLDTSDVEPMSHVFPVNNVFREDVVTNGDGTKQTLANAPEKKDDSFVVPKTIVG